MIDQLTVPPRVVVTSTVSGLMMMSFFTLAWVSNLFAGWAAPAAWSATAIALACVLCFVGRAVQLIRSRHAFPAELSEEQQRQRRTSGRTFGLLFGAEAAAIWVVVLLLGATGRSDYVVPAIALIVGLHFFPMARLFRRRVDLYIAAWTCLVAVAGLILTGVTDLPAARVDAWVAVGAAAATAAYGWYMTGTAGDLLRRAARG
ncbi:hypothetical protein ACWT_6659 [Actinoplanes sp. SE50]|uniref:hypothetical protein n=1 Tax=unclassified Actinoplanes TaxID=2626549 RepID=UPI00023ECA2D|nr:MULTISPECIES: hypothetical protein [unclassified Actinoplanes]AEV87671.1 hypothetical protein ACPL_6789 [Actinoplanes sp. SE50/110]ATO86074.1 hypothetical protein ACWT_6659 [Actinoplanes sp. SE50]SLM03488.1 hypothetical protein ACSP50_6778 [Actinoplanes sp. SE50/110]